MSDKLSIKLKILERNYPLNIKWEEEEKLREAAKRINEIVNRFKQHYPNKDYQDLLAMACLQFASKLIDLEKNQDSNDLDKKIEELCEDLDDFIKVNQ